MASTPRDTDRLELRLERRLSDALKTRAKSEGFGNVQELIRSVLADYLAVRKEIAVTETANSSTEIDLRALLIEANKANVEANRTIAELTKTITAMSQGKG